jgi:hypothetical protein
MRKCLMILMDSEVRLLESYKKEVAWAQIMITLVSNLSSYQLLGPGQYNPPQKEGKRNTKASNSFVTNVNRFGPTAPGSSYF